MGRGERLRFASLSADEAKRLGQKTGCREDWDSVRVSAMRAVVKAKFGQNPNLARLLAGTGNRLLQEGNRWGDVFWGVDLRTGEGENRLGRILMELRQEYQEQGLPDTAGFPRRKRVGDVDGISVEFGDITQSDCDSIVNAADRTLLGGGGVYEAVHREAGRSLAEECRKLGGCETGGAKITVGHRLRAAYVIHTVGPHYGEEGDEAHLVSCYRSCMEAAREKGIRSIALPVISAGRLSYPKKAAARIAVGTVRAWLGEHPDYPIRVVFCCLDSALYGYFCQEINV